MIPPVQICQIDKKPKPETAFEEKNAELWKPQALQIKASKTSNQSLRKATDVQYRLIPWTPY